MTTARTVASPPAYAPQAEGAAPWADPTTLQEVRPAVRELLLASPSFAELSPEVRQRLAREMVKVSAYLANPDGIATSELARAATVPARPQAGPPFAAAQADGVTEAGKRATEDRGLVGEDFVAGGVREGVEQFGALVQKVDFPKFVAGLIQNVFQAIVDARSSRWRRTASCSPTSPRRWTSSRRTTSPRTTRATGCCSGSPTSSSCRPGRGAGFAEDDPAVAGHPSWSRKGDASRGRAPMIYRGAATGQADHRSVGRGAGGGAGHAGAAADGPQAPADAPSMVMLGINRIVVTDGLINAKVVFDFRASDQATARARASLTGPPARRHPAPRSPPAAAAVSPFSAGASVESS